MKKKKLLSILLTLAMLASLVPFAAVPAAALENNQYYAFADGPAAIAGTATLQTAASATAVPTGSQWQAPTWANGSWYYVEGTQTISQRVTVNGTINLILCDGATLTATAGITVASGNTLNIYSQSYGDNMGKLIAGGTSTTTNNAAGIGGTSDNNTRNSGTIVIHGGDITATGRSGGAGIGGGRGANQNNQYSGGSCGTVTIYGGTVNATGSAYNTTGYSAGIGGGARRNTNGSGGSVTGAITIYGGTVTANKGGGAAQPIGCGSNGTNYTIPTVTDVTIGTNTTSTSSCTVQGKRAKPGAPTQSGDATTTSITLAAITNGEYKVGTDDWQDSPVFTGMKAGTEYTFYQRVAADSNHLASDASDGAAFSTAPHTHDFTYSIGADASIISAYCNAADCYLQGKGNTATLTIAAPAHTAVGDNNPANAIITDADGIQGTATVKYQQKTGGTYGDETETAPTGAGDYKASITLGDATAYVTAYVEYTISKASPGTPTVTMDDYIWGDVAANVPTPTIDQYAGGGAVTYYYSTAPDTTGTVWVQSAMTTETLDAGIYYMYATIAATGDYAAYTTAAVNFEVLKATWDAPDGAYFVASDVDSGTLGGLVPGASYIISYAGIQGESSVQANANGRVVFAAGVQTGTLEVSRAEDTNHNASSPKEIPIAQETKPTLTKINCTTADSANGSITVTTPAGKTYEYTTAPDTEPWVPFDGDTLNGLTPGTYAVRVRANGANLASEFETAEIKATTTTTAFRYYDVDTGAYVTVPEQTASQIESDSIAWSAGWYVVNGTVDIDSRVTVTGDVYLILADAATLNAKEGITVSGSSNSLTIYPQEKGTGALVASGAHTVISTAAGIGGFTNQPGGNVTIHGGTVTAYGGGSYPDDYGSWGSAGIGSGGNSNGTTESLSAGKVIIYNGTVNAYGNFGGAGIGGGGVNNDTNGAPGAEVEIYGGTVTAVGSGGAAGIGGGSHGGAGGKVTISGGEVTATGGRTDSNEQNFAGAGIGGGNNAAGGTVTISGGKVTATGGNAGNNTNAGAGIGGGNGGAGGSVNITGGEVDATGGNANAKGIGAGRNNSTNGTLHLGENIRAFSNTSDNMAASTVKVDGEKDFDGTYNRYMWTRVTRPITITAGSDNKAYDGTELTCGGYEITSDTGLADGDYIAGITLTGSQTVAGSSYNVASDVVIKSAAGEDVSDCYNVTYVDGTLTVTPAELTIVAESDTVTYDGTQYSIGDAYFLDADSQKVQMDLTNFTGVTVSGYGTIVDTYLVTFTGVTPGTTKSDDGNYLIVAAQNGELVIEPRALIITAGSTSKEYDGTALTTAADAYTISNDQDAKLAQGDSVVSVTLTGSQTVAGSSYNVASDAIIHNANGDNVSDCYDITFNKGTLTVTQKAVTITGGSTSKAYDGTALTYNVCADASAVLATDDYIDSATLTGSQTFPGSSANTPSAVVIKNGAGDDVTASYVISYADGTLEVTENTTTIKFKPVDAELPFGESELTDQEVTITEGALPAGFTATATVAPAVPSFQPQNPNNIGKELDSKITALKIVNGNDEDVTAYFTGKDVTTKGKLKVVGRTITVTAASGSKVYDGTALTKNSYTVEDDMLMAGDVIKGIVVTGSQTAVGSSANKASGGSVYRADQDVSNLYQFVYVDGTLTVTAKDEPPVYTGGGSSTKTYKVNVADAENGTVKVSKTSAAEGDKITVTTTADKDFVLDAITVKGDKTGSIVTVSNGAFTMPAEDVTVTATFKKEAKPETDDGLTIAELLEMFPDLDPNGWYLEDVRSCVEAGYMKGVGTGKFAPNEKVSRAMVAQLLWNIAGNPTGAGAAPFDDIKPGDWFYEAVNWAYANGITKGTGKGFEPNRSITREQLAVMLYNYAKLLGKGFQGLWSFQLNFPDAGEVSPWANEAVSWMVMNGIIKGTNDGNGNTIIKPQGDATRVQLAAMINRFCELLK